MEKPIFIATRKSWNKEKKRYEPSQSFDLNQGSRIEFGGITISLEGSPSTKDILDRSQSIILRKEPEEQILDKIYVFEQREDMGEKPKRMIIGEDILLKSPSFYFSNLSDLVSLSLFKGNVKEHPEMLEIVPGRPIGENQSSPLL